MQIRQALAALTWGSALFLVMAEYLGKKLVTKNEVATILLRNDAIKM